MGGGFPVLHKPLNAREPGGDCLHPLSKLSAEQCWPHKPLHKPTVGSYWLLPQAGNRTAAHIFLPGQQITVTITLNIIWNTNKQPAEHQTSVSYVPSAVAWKGHLFLEMLAAFVRWQSICWLLSDHLLGPSCLGSMINPQTAIQTPRWPFQWFSVISKEQLCTLPKCSSIHSTNTRQLLLPPIVVTLHCHNTLSQSKTVDASKITSLV